MVLVGPWRPLAPECLCFYPCFQLVDKMNTGDSINDIQMDLDDVSVVNGIQILVLLPVYCTYLSFDLKAVVRPYKYIFPPLQRAFMGPIYYKLCVVQSKLGFLRTFLKMKH